MDFSRLNEVLESSVMGLSTYYDVETRLDLQDRGFKPTDFQLSIFFNSAFELGLTGAAGCGKTNGMIALALFHFLFDEDTKKISLNIEGKGRKVHEKVLILRKTQTQLEGIKRTLNDLCDGHYNPSNKNYYLPWKDTIPLRLDSLFSKGKEQNYQGIEHDLVIFDEANQFPYSQIATIMGWLRSPTALFCRALLSFNVPLDKEQLWIVKHYERWIHPDLADLQSGEIVYYYKNRVTQETIYVDSPKSFMIGGEEIHPLSRSCIVGKPSDNPHLARTNYYELLKSYPYELYKILAEGDFSIAFKANAFQLLSHKELERAKEGWSDVEADNLPLTAIGADVARGGSNRLVITPLKGDRYICPQVILPGVDVRDNFQVASLMKKVWLENGGDNQTLFITDVTGGLGSGTHDILKEQGYNAVDFDSRERAYETISKGRMTFSNCKSQAAYLLREGIKEGYYRIAPQNKSLCYELQTWMWSIPRFGIIAVDTKGEDIKSNSTVSWDSPDCGDSAMIACSQVDLHKHLDL